MKLYKYRTVDNFKFFVYILLNNKLFAGKYKDMNDPMEGIYKYTPDFLTLAQRNSIFEEKNSIHFCCFSKDRDNPLLWSHYANGHRGIVIGININDVKYKVKEIKYVDEFEHIENYDDNTALEILCKKLNFWNYENEFRAFSINNEQEIEVEIIEIILGMNMKLEDENLIRKLVEIVNPQISVKKNIRYF